MTYSPRTPALALCLGLAACIQGGQKTGGNASPPAASRSGDVTYSPLATADQADAPGAPAAAAQTFEGRPLNDKNLGSGDARPSDTFQYYFVQAVQAARPQHQVAGGNGTSLATAFFAHDVPERAELQSAMNDLLFRYPDRHAVSGVLMRGATNRKYVVQVTFVSRGSSHTLYYDVSRWVGFTRIHG